MTNQRTDTVNVTRAINIREGSEINFTTDLNWIREELEQATTQAQLYGESAVQAICELYEKQEPTYTVDENGHIKFSVRYGHGKGRYENINKCLNK